jgi:hypothetical protein
MSVLLLGSQLIYGFLVLHFMIHFILRKDSRFCLILVEKFQDCLEGSLLLNKLSVCTS